MSYIPRLDNDAPSTSDKLWIQRGSGGYNPCIYARGNSVLPNCFSGDTEIITKDGLVRLDAIVDKEVEVLSKDWIYRKAKGGYYGLQPMYRIDFTNSLSFRCTANHRWIVIQDNEYVFKTTLELTTEDEIPCTDGITFMRSVHPIGHSLPVFCIEEPETHTMVLKGGILTGQCVGYAYGRFMEIMGTTTCNLSTDNAGLWFGYTQDGYERGQTPQLGAVICWRNPGRAGHVAIVEKINADGSIVTSNSAWNSTRYYVQTLYPPAYTWSSNYILQGFIYNPKGSKYNASKISEFIDVAKKAIGTQIPSVSLMDKLTSGAFVNWCAKSVDGLIGKVIPAAITAGDFCKAGTSKGMGSFIPGPLFKENPTPEPGDIVLLRSDETKKYKSRYECDQLAIVSEVNGTSVYAITVSKNSMIIKAVYQTNYNAIAGYYRPKWSLVENSTSAMIGYGKLGKFYDTQNTDEDATIREVAYTNGTDILIPKTDIKLSVINYTTMMSAIMDDLIVPGAFSPNTGTDVTVSGSIPANARIVIQYLMGKGLSAAVACGIAGNIQHESNFNTAAVGDGGTSFGICQWHYDRGVRMKQMAGADWANNLTGQLDFLWYELQSDSQLNAMLGQLQKLPDNSSGAQQAADIFVRKFERPADPSGESVKRQASALQFYNAITVQLTTTSSGSSLVSSNSAFSGKTIEIPSWVAQGGIDTTYTNYDYWYTRWAKSSVQYQVSRLWSATGKKSNRNIATINGMYLVAVKPKFGTNGDKISIVLENGQIINAIIADIKANENNNEWGHGSIRALNIIEFEASDGTDYKSTVNTLPDITGWKGQDVVKIINAGTILNGG